MSHLISNQLPIAAYSPSLPEKTITSKGNAPSNVNQLIGRTFEKVYEFASYAFRKIAKAIPRPLAAIGNVVILAAGIGVEVLATMVRILIKTAVKIAALLFGMVIFPIKHPKIAAVAAVGMLLAVIII